MDQADMFRRITPCVWLNACNFLEGLASEHDALMRPVRVMEHEVSNGVFADSFRMQRVMVVGLKIAVPRDFPARAVDVTLLVQVPVRQIERLQWVLSDKSNLRRGGRSRSLSA